MAEPTLIERLRACELLSAEQIAELERLPEASNPDPKVLARVVLQRGWLTRFQVSQVATGKGKDLFVGSYVLVEKLGEGGMGQVFKARHRHMDRLVALKLIRKEKLGGADAVARFYQEVKAAAQLHHPNIVLAFDAGQTGGTHFFAMEYVEGPDLTRLVREKGTLPVAQACEFVRQAAVGLQHAHERGLVHRDIKPSNLLVTASAAAPVVKILDLGLARLGDTFAKERNLTKMGQVIGTPDYLAPEQALDARNVDIRADIYSLGCSLYFLLTARAPFEAESLTELLMKHQLNEPTPIRSLRPDVPPALEALLRRMMAKKVQDRPSTPAEVAEALEPFARGEQGGHADAPSPVSIAAPTAPRSDETWAGLSNDAEVVARPKARASRSRDTIDEEPRPRRKKEKSNKGLLIGGAVGAGVLVLSLIVGGVVMLSPKKPVKVVEKIPNPQGTQGQQVPPPEVIVPPVQPKDDPPPAGAVAAIDRGVAQGKMIRTPQAGGGDGGTEEYADLGAGGALLTGLEVGVGKWGNQDVVYYLRPVYQSGAARTLGPTFGAKQERTFLLEAKSGYAIGGITINAGSGLDGLSITFMAIKGATLDPNDTYSSYWVGGKGGAPQTLGGDGSPVVGLFGKLSRGRPPVANGLGLVMRSNGRPAPVTPAGDPERLVGGGFGGEVYRDVAPEGGVLVGLEVGLGKFNEDDITQSLRPIFRTGEKETKGTQRGTKLDRVTNLVAKQGYAVGAMRVKTGANADGLSLTFMRVKGAALDPADAYESDWVGDTRPGEKILLTGGGRRVLGVAIKANARDVTGYGLVLRPGGAPATAGVLAGEVRQFIQPKNDLANRVFFMPDGKTGLTFVGPAATKLDPSTGNQLEVYRVKAPVPSFLSMSKDGKRITDVGHDRRIRVIDAETGKLIQTLHSEEYDAGVHGVALSPDGEYALSCHGGAFFSKGELVGRRPDGTFFPLATDVVLWNLENGKIEHRFGGGTTGSALCAFTDDGRYVLACNYKVPLRVWELKSKKLLYPVEGANRMNGRTVRSFVPAGGSEVLIACGDGTLLLFDCATGKVVREFNSRATYCTGLVITPDNKTALTIGGVPALVDGKPVSKGVAMVWDVEKGVEVARVDLPTQPGYAAVSPDGKFALVADPKVIRYFDLAKLGRGDGTKPPDPPETVPPPVAPPKPDAVAFVGHTGPVSCVCLSPDGKSLLSGGEDGSVRLWEAATGKLVRVVHEARNKSPIRAVRFTHDGAGVLALDESRDLYNGEAKTGRGISSGNIGFGLPAAPATGFDVSMNDDFVAAVMGRSFVPMPIKGAQIRGVTVTLAATGLCVVSLGEGRLFAVGDDTGGVRIGDMPSTKATNQLSFTPHKQSVLALAYNAKTKHLISGSADKTIKVTPLKAGVKRVPRTASGHEGEVTCLAVSPDGKRFASGSKDKTVRVWDLTTLKRLHKFTDDDEVRGVAFAADGKSVYSAGKTLRVWSLAEAKKDAGKESKPEEKP